MTEHSPLIYALLHDRYDAAKLLIEHGANVNGRIYRNPLVCVCAMKKTVIGYTLVKLLVNKGADVNSVSDTGSRSNTGIPLICLLREDADMVEWIVHQGADVNLRCDPGMRPLHLMFEYYNSSSDNLYKVISIMLANGAVANSAYDSKSPVLVATESAFACIYSCIELLIKAGANVNSTYNGYTPLINAISDGRTSIAKLLIESGADVNAKRSNGLTPLYEASRTNNLNIVKLLIEKGAHTNIRYSRHTPFSIAKYYKHKCKDVADYLSTIPDIE